MLLFLSGVSARSGLFLPDSLALRLNHPRMFSHSANGSSGQSGELEFEFIDKTPTPLFTGLKGFHDWMFGCMEMPAGVFILRGVTAADVPAAHAQTEMNPLVAGFQAFFAAVSVRSDLLDLREVFTLAHTSTLHLKQ